MYIYIYVLFVLLWLMAEHNATTYWNNIKKRWCYWYYEDPSLKKKEEEINERQR